MKKMICMILAFALLFLCGCQGNYGYIDLREPVNIPSDGIIEKNVLSQIKEENAIATFSGISGDYRYEWMIFGSDITETVDINLSVSITETDDLHEFLDRHPYDISGSEQQRTALAKILLTAPDILFLDEPTKCFDAEFTVTFAAILKKLLQQGVTILMVSHDVAFCAENASRCGMFFDGTIVAEGAPVIFL